MRKIYTFIFSYLFAVSISLIFIFSQTICGQNSSQQNIEQAKIQLETLYKQWKWLDRDYYQTLDAELLKRIDKSPKGEFETSKQFEDRTARAERLEEQISEEVLANKELKRESLDRQMNQIMTMEFDSPFATRLGTYHADTQRFPISFASGSEEFLFVPLPEAKEFKEKAAQSEAFGKFALLLDFDGRAKEYLLTGKITLNGKSYQFTPKDMNVERAMFLLFGNFDAASKRSVWRYIYASQQDKKHNDADKPNVELVLQRKSDLESIYVFNNYKMYATPIFSKSFQENGLSKFLVVAGSVEDFEGEGEAFNISVASFVQKNGIWKLENLNRNLGEYEFAFEGVRNIKFIKIGKDKYAVLFQSYAGANGSGAFEEYTNHYIGRINGVIKEILTFTNELQGSEEWKEAKVEYLPTTDSDYYNIKVTNTGGKSITIGEGYNKMVKPVSSKPYREVILYKFVDGNYKPVSPAK